MTTMFESNPTVDVQSIITREFMLIDFTGKSYRGRAKDKVQTQKLNTESGAKRNAAKVELELFAGCDSEISAINAAIGGLRQTFYDMTQPWSDDATRREGPRLIANALLFDFIRRYKEALTEIDSKLGALELVWEQRCAQAAENLGTMYRPELYPSFDEVRRKWAVRIDYQPVPASADFGRLNLPSNIAVRMAEQAEKRSIVLVNAALKDAYGNALEIIQRIANGTRVEPDGKKGKIYESTVEAMQLMIDNLRHFNITQNPELEQYRQRMARMMSGIDVKELRDSESARTHVHTEATKLADDMLASMQAFAA